MILCRTLSRIGEWLPQGWGDAGRQVALFVLAELSYETVRGIAEGQRAEAFANGSAVIDIERSTGTFFEPDFQSSLINHQWIIEAANWMYMNSHFLVTTTFLLWLYFYRNPNFYFVRNMFMVAMALAIVGYVLVPTAPPRLYPQEGFIDTITQYAQVNHDSGLVKVFINPYAAIPSMHCAFSMMIGVTGALLARHRITRVLWCLYPAMVLFVVLVTANHFWVDSALGWIVAGLSALSATMLARVRPAAWSWRPATA
ncbi:MAG: inositol phosphorylceramide synthase [Solirubrobacterales bacterium]|nr:inositol phosphorylceramide synthase [Solirubrobacterales bacterium]